MATTPPAAGAVDWELLTLACGAHVFVPFPSAGLPRSPLLGGGGGATRRAALGDEDSWWQWSATPSMGIVAAANTAELALEELLDGRDAAHSQ